LRQTELPQPGHLLRPHVMVFTFGSKHDHVTSMLLPRRGTSLPGPNYVRYRVLWNSSLLERCTVGDFQNYGIVWLNKLFTRSMTLLVAVTITRPLAFDASFVGVPHLHSTSSRRNVTGVELVYFMAFNIRLLGGYRRWANNIFPKHGQLAAGAFHQWRQPDRGLLFSCGS
jgi:hypothetical protein